MTPRTILPIALTALLLATVPAQAAPAPAAVPPPDPCANAAELTTRDAILAAIPPEDAIWTEALNKRGIRKEEDGWMQYFQGGSATASNRAFIAAFGDYCTARLRAAVAPKKTPAKAAPAATPAPAPEKEEHSIQDAKRRSAQASARAAAIAKTVLAPEPAQAAPAADCPALIERAQTCRDAGIGDGNLGSDFKCRKAFKDEKAGNCGG